MQRIPIPAQASLTFAVTLGGQRCQISVYQKSTGVFMDLTANGKAIVQGAVCLDRVRIVRHKYLGFIGDLSFVDTQGKSDPQFTGFGTRYALVYIDA